MSPSVAAKPLSEPMPTVLHDSGNCQGADPDEFFPAAQGGAAMALARELAAKYCDAKGGCPVKDICLDWAVRTTQPGVWGGTSEAERRRIRKLRRSAKAVTR